eukprot:TRINITY_DN77851_c0_g1_i1.p1 TRINITY_DN77851_c0_g1~~TRINITY_DN77851_c0_g1_i1.p1  ORF type:complete len:111 (-),score=4.48 TRINITY_DN77851_c0_g1_i1:36-368(-)
MREFFRGWRRKVGCLILLIAFMLSVIWVRSYLADDVLTIAVSGGQHDLSSNNGEFRWRAFSSTGLFPLFGQRFDESLDISVSYCPIVTVLAAVAAFLILWTPRKQGNHDA